MNYYELMIEKLRAVVCNLTNEHGRSYFTRVS